MADVEAAARQALAEVRDAVSGYRQVSLAQALAEARSALSAAGIALARRRAGRAAAAARSTRSSGWVVREATTNVLRHSGARSVTVESRPSADAVTLTVTDDGRGRRRRRRASGLAGLAERVRPLGGRLDAGPADGRGFRLTAAVPLTVRRRAAADRWRRPVIRVLIAEDQTLVRGALRALLELEEDIEVVAEVGRGDAVVAPRCEHRPDVALLDIEMPGRRRHRGRPGAGRRRCPAAARSSSPRSAGRASCAGRWRSGAAGFLVKDAPVAELARGIRAVMAGERVIDRDLAAAALAIGATPLSAREADVLRAAAGRRDRRRHRRPAVPVGGDGAQLPVVGDRQDRRADAGRGRAGRGGEGLAVVEGPPCPPPLAGSRRDPARGPTTAGAGWAPAAARGSRRSPGRTSLRPG